MKHNFRQVMDWIGLSEGGYVNHPKDPGGATDRGITQRTYSAWLAARGQKDRSVRGIPKEVAEDILAEQYFAPVWFDRLPAGVDYAMADYAVNSGPARAVKEIQRIVGAPVDGVMGNITLGAIMEREPVELIRLLCEARMRFLRSLRTWPTFGRGWTRRVMGEVTGAQDDDIGVIDRATRLAHGASAIPAPAPSTIPVAKATEPSAPGGGTTATGLAGAVAAAGAALSSIGQLHPAVQALAIVGACAAGYALFRLWQAGRVRL